MSVQSVLLPVFAQVGLTFFLLFWMGRLRVRSLQTGEVRFNEIALGQPGWPSRATQIGNAFHNQLQLPILFYVLVPLALLTKQADLLFVALSWLFVALRIAHAAIHVTTNNVPRRFYAFLAGAVVLVLMWAIFAARILLS